MTARQKPAVVTEEHSRLTGYSLASSLCCPLQSRPHFNTVAVMSQRSNPIITTRQQEKMCHFIFDSNSCVFDEFLYFL